MEDGKKMVETEREREKERENGRWSIYLECGKRGQHWFGGGAQCWPPPFGVVSKHHPLSCWSSSGTRFSSLFFLSLSLSVYFLSGLLLSFLCFFLLVRDFFWSGGGGRHLVGFCSVGRCCWLRAGKIAEKKTQSRQDESSNGSIAAKFEPNAMNSWHQNPF